MAPLWSIRKWNFKKTRLRAETRQRDIPLISTSAGDALWSKARRTPMFPSEAAFQSGEGISDKSR